MSGNIVSKYKEFYDKFESDSVEVFVVVVKTKRIGIGEKVNGIDFGKNIELECAEIEFIFSCNTKELKSEKAYIIYPESEWFSHWHPDFSGAVHHICINKIKAQWAENFDVPTYCFSKEFNDRPSYFRASICPELDIVIRQYFYNCYESEEQEIIALVENPSRINETEYSNFKTYWAKTIAVVFCDEAKIIEEPMYIKWPHLFLNSKHSDSTNGDFICSNLLRQYGQVKLRKMQICRLRVRKLKSELVKSGSAMSLYMTQMLEENARFPELEFIKEHYRDTLEFKDYVLNDDILGKITMAERDLSVMSCTVAWCCRNLTINLNIDPNDKNTWMRARITARQMLLQAKAWNNVFIEMIVEKLIEGTIESEQETFDDDIDCEERNFYLYEAYPLESVSKNAQYRVYLTSLSCDSSGNFIARFNERWDYWNSDSSDFEPEIHGSISDGVKSIKLSYSDSFTPNDSFFIGSIDCSYRNLRKNRPAPDYNIKDPDDSYGYDDSCLNNSMYYDPF